MAPLRPRRWPAALLLLALPLEACGGSALVRVRVPIQQNPEGELVAERCTLDCRIHAGALASKYAECLAGCPGAQIDGGERCDATDRAPRAVCVESSVDPSAEVAESDEPKRDVGAAEAVNTGLAVASLLLDLATLGKKRKSSSKSSGSKSGKSSSSGGSSGGQHSSASPSKGHSSASPSKGSSSGHSAASPSSN